MAWRRPLALLLAATCGEVSAAGPVDGARAFHARPIIALIIDDMGENRAAGLRALNLPGPVTYSFLPHRSHVAPLARLAHERNKEIVLHLPMEALDRRPLGAGGITEAMSEPELVRTLHDNLAAVPHAVGINNHMGSLLTRHPVYMQWLMREIRHIGALYFVDSRTTSDSVAYEVAGRFGVPNLQRDVFLDHDRSELVILKQFEQLIGVAHRNGMALGIGHPYPETIAVLERLLPELDAFGVKLVPVSELVRRQTVIRHVRASGRVQEAAVIAPRGAAPGLLRAPPGAHNHQ